MSQLLIDNKIDRVDLVAEGSCSVADILIMKGKDGANMPETVKEILAKMKPEHSTAISDYITVIEKAKCDAEKASAEVSTDKKDAKKAKADKEKAENDLAVAKAKIATLEADKKAVDNTDEANFEEVLKSMPTSAQLVMKQLKQTNDDLVAKAKEAQDAAENEQAVAKAKELAVLPIKQEDLIGIIKSKPANEILVMLDSLAKAFEASSVFKAAGTDTHDGAAGTSAYDQVETMASEIVKSKNVSIEKARLEVFNSNPDLYSKYNAGGAK